MNIFHILVVDDEHMVADEICRELKSDGNLDVGIALSTDAARGKIRLRTPNLILMDIEMPGELNGIRSAMEFRELFGVPIVFVTAYSDVKTREKAAKASPLGFVVKGDWSKLKQIVADAIADRPRILASFVGKVRSIEHGKARVFLLEQQTGNAFSADCNLDFLVNNRVSQIGDEFRCEVVESRGMTTKLEITPLTRPLDEIDGETIRRLRQKVDSQFAGLQLDIE